MDDAVVIILTLLIMVVGAVNQIRKKQKAPLPEEPGKATPPKKNFWEELLDSEEFNQVNKQETKTDDWEPYYEEPEKKVETPKTKSEPIILKPENEGVHSIKTEKMDIIKTSEIGSEKKAAKLPGGFTLRRAIIFSEIIQRKYF